MRRLLNRQSARESPLVPQSRGLVRGSEGSHDRAEQQDREWLESRHVEAIPKEHLNSVTPGIERSDGDFLEVHD